jgi:hypothetical protein
MIGDLKVLAQVQPDTVYRIDNYTLEIVNKGFPQPSLDSGSLDDALAP